MSFKQKIEYSFDKGALHYDWAASIQREAAEKLISFAPEKTPLKILEIGCGTGFLTKMLVQKYPEAQITALDISAKMIEKCRAKLPFVTFKKTDGEEYIPSEKFDLIISNMTVQWFDDPMAGLNHYKKFLNPDGQVLFSTLGDQNFKEWCGVLNDLKLPNAILKNISYDGIFEEQKEAVMYQHPIDFVKALKNMGATPSSVRPITPAQLKSACNALQTKHCCTITWHILFGRIF